MVPIMADEVDMRAIEPVDAAPVEAASVSFPKEPEPVAPVSFAPAALAEPAHVKTEPEEEHEAKPSLASRMRHWMDAIVSAPTHEESREKAAPKEAHEEAKGNDDWVAKLAKPRSPEVVASGQPPAPAPSEPPPAMASAVAKPAEDSFFAEESASEGFASEESVAPAGVASGEVAPIEEAPVEAAAVETGDVSGVAESVPMARASDFEEAVASQSEPEMWERDEETTSSLRDPELDVPPAVHVTPEPLLVGEEPESVSEYREQLQEAPAAGTFEVAASPEPVAEDVPEEASLPEPSFEPVAAESAVDYHDERVPTGPPPNRQALAEIPFLNPPQGFDPNTRTPQASAADASTVDAVVEKLLERLQPQLHDLLSQSVLKPLVENLLQQENNKKEK
jgi:hypothetical protein